MTLPIITAFFVSFAIVLIIGMPIIKYLHKLKCGQKILEDGPKWHMPKQDTPTMGGIIFISALVICMAAMCFFPSIRNDLTFLPILTFALLFGAIGFIDDFTKIKHKANMGLTAMQKLLLQIVIAVLYLSFLRYIGLMSPSIYIPFANITIEIGWYIFLPFAAFVIVGTVNAVNLTDGIDGLAAGVTMPVSAFFVFAFILIKMTSLACLSAALFGALTAFMFFNANPAKVFMGDTGSLFLGGMVCGLAFAGNIPLILILVGIVYICETLSDIIQVAYFKITHGKRFFKMAPLHHHFELCGWSEKKIVFIFTAVTVVMCIIAYLGIRNIYTV